MTVSVRRVYVQANALIDDGSLINIVRFANISCRSRDIRQLLQTIAAQLSAAVCPSSMRTVAAAIMEPHNSYDEILAHFRCLLESFPEHRNLVIFIDGVDRLAPRRQVSVAMKVKVK